MKAIPEIPIIVCTDSFSLYECLATFDLSQAAQYPNPDKEAVTRLNDRLEWQRTNLDRGIKYVPINLKTRDDAADPPEAETSQRTTPRIARLTCPRRRNRTCNWQSSYASKGRSPQPAHPLKPQIPWRSKTLVHIAKQFPNQAPREFDIYLESLCRSCRLASFTE
ncbi:hypothetical protein GGR54DRAFT_42658 [Hypoxylon sp. NC1633]|nr:hypothetical protein GGR54DRAFT_42658 [Hypoxylon sp. NC1633]